jgi:hypothetical protein
MGLVVLYSSAPVFSIRFSDLANDAGSAPSAIGQSWDLALYLALNRPCGVTKILQFCHGQLSSEQAKTAVWRGNQTLSIDMLKGLEQSFTYLFDRLDTAIGDRNRAENYRGSFKMFEQGQIIVAMGIFE